jgi:hypothetical protein
MAPKKKAPGAGMGSEAESGQPGPPQTGTGHRLAYGELSPRKFEELCYWLVVREEYERVEHLGASGGEGGRDITAWRDGEQWAFQCKRVKRFGPTAAVQAAKKVLGLAKKERPRGLVLVVACDLSADARGAVREACGEEMECEFWAGAELDERVKRYPDIVAEFFQLPPRATGREYPGGPGEVVRPLQLPLGLPTFRGQERYLKEIEQRLHPGGERLVGIVGLEGMGGVGKSALAVEAAHRWGKRFKDGVVWVDLREWDVAGGLRHIASTFGYGEQAKQLVDLREMAGLARSAVGEREVLIILDNAERAAAEEFGLLVPGGECCVTLVTSR